MTESTAERQRRINTLTKRTIRAAYSPESNNGVPTERVVGEVARNHDFGEGEVRDVLDRLERTGEVYRVGGCWRLTYPSSLPFEADADASDALE